MVPPARGNRETLSPDSVDNGVVRAIFQKYFSAIRYWLIFERLETSDGVVVTESGAAGLRANDASCVNNLVGGAQFIQNAGGWISEASPRLGK